MKASQIIRDVNIASRTNVIRMEGKVTIGRETCPARLCVVERIKGSGWIETGNREIRVVELVREGPNLYRIIGSEDERKINLVFVMD